MFYLPGLGRLVFQAIQQRDLIVVEGVVMLLVFAVITVTFLVDLAYPGGAVLNEVGMFSIVAGLIGILVTAIYVAGLIERRDPALFGIGLDSYLVAATYLGGIALLFTLR